MNDNYKQVSIPFFSVVIPVYNKAPHIKRSVGSVINQTFTDFELIIIDDASTDNSLEEVIKFNDPRINIFRRDKPGPGGYAARNLGIKEANGSWIAFLDADDEWNHQHLQHMQAVIIENPDIMIFSCGWNESIGNGRIFNNRYFTENKNRGQHIFTLETFISQSSVWPIWTSVAVISHQELVKLNGFDDSFTQGGDVDLWLRLLLTDLKKGVWSPYIGATYHRDSINMVTHSLDLLYNPFSITIEKYCKLNRHTNHSLCLKLKKFSNKGSLRILERRIKSAKCDKEFVMNLFFWNELPFYIKGFLNILVLLPFNLQKTLLESIFWLFDYSILSKLLRKLT